ncbi:hypothetical protein M8C21_004601, partial [Ambrosia artemisiifolia]
MVCTSVFVVFTHLPSASSTKVLPWVFALLVALFPVTYLLEGQVRVQAILAESGIDTMSEEDSKLTALLAVEGARTSLLGLYAAIFMLIALEIKFELASLMREKVNERGGGLKHSQSGQSTNSLANFPPKMRFMQQRRVSTVPAFTIKRMAAEGAWMPAVGNVATIMCFAICLILNVNLTGGSNRAIFFLAPILLLLNQDSDFVAGFGDKQRYFPVTVVISGYMALTSLYIIWEETWQGNVGWGMQIGGADWFFALQKEERLNAVAYNTSQFGFINSHRCCEDKDIGAARDYIFFDPVFNIQTTIYVRIELTSLNEFLIITAFGVLVSALLSYGPLQAYGLGDLHHLRFETSIQFERLELLKIDEDDGVRAYVLAALHHLRFETSVQFDRLDGSTPQLLRRRGLLNIDEEDDGACRPISGIECATKTYEIVV